MRHLDLVFNGGGHQLGEDEFHIPAQARNLLPMNVPPLLLPSMALLPLMAGGSFQIRPYPEPNSTSRRWHPQSEIWQNRLKSVELHWKSWVPKGARPDARKQCLCEHEEGEAKLEPALAPLCDQVRRHAGSRVSTTLWSILSTGNLQPHSLYWSEGRL
jgi:hypothetical protein